MALIGKNNHTSVLNEDASLYQAQEEKSEKQKWSELNKQQRIRYFKDYYLLKCLAAIAIAIFLGGFLWTILKPQKDPALFLAIVHNPLPQDARITLEQSFSEILLPDSDSQEIRIDDAFSESYESEVKLSAFLAAQEVDLIVTNEEHFQSLAKNGCFADLNELIPEFSKKYKGLLYLTEGYTEEATDPVSGEATDSKAPAQTKKAYGIDVTNSSMFQPLWSHSQRAILGIIQNCTQQENAILALEHIVSN